MEIRIHPKDKMTPAERTAAFMNGGEADRMPCVPFMEEFKCKVSGVSIWEYWHDPEKMAQAEIRTFNRYGHDRMMIGPNTRGITEALGGESIYPDQAMPYIKDAILNDYSRLAYMEPVDAKKHTRIQAFIRAAEILSACAGKIVPVESSIGGPFTIASNLRGVERLLKDCRKRPQDVHSLLRIIVESQKKCIDEAAVYGLGTAMADPVASPALIGPKLYETFVFPYTKELTDYALEKTGRKVSLHMCGKTYSIWKYLCQYELNELSLDNVIDLERAAAELGPYIPIAGNVDPVDVVMNGTKEEITLAVRHCKAAGAKSEKGFTLATGCDVSLNTAPDKIDWFMEAARALN